MGTERAPASPCSHGLQWQRDPLPVVGLLYQPLRVELLGIIWHLHKLPVEFNMHIFMASSPLVPDKADASWERGHFD